MSTNFNDNLPVPPALGLNVKWQTDGSGNLSAYLPGGGVPTTATDLLAQSANIAAATLYSVPSGASGLYEVLAYIIVSQAATTSSTLPKVQIIYTDNNNSTSQALDVTVTNPGNLLTTFEQGSVVINAAPSLNVQYQTTGYASVGGTAMNYAVHIRIRPI